FGEIEMKNIYKILIGLLVFGLAVGTACATTIVISAYVACIAAIPPLVFWGSVIVGVIAVGVLGYSLVWCMARNLQDSDWGSDTATAITSAALVLALPALALALAALATSAALALIALALIALALAALIALATSADNPASSWYYVFRFIGAYLNYRKRMKATPTASVVEETKE
ncbi:MAG: hypothetical protein WCA21_21240, partial [Terracidiphilus sp.]